MPKVIYSWASMPSTKVYTHKNRHCSTRIGRSNVFASLVTEWMRSPVSRFVWRMEKSNEQKTTRVQRFLTAALKLKNERHERRSASPVKQLGYGLPKSFLHAVDTGRLQAGYDILPRHRDQSAPPSIARKPLSPSSSFNETDDHVLRKIPFRRRPRQQPPTIKPTWSPSPRPAVQLMAHPRSLMLNRSHRLGPMMPMPSPIRPRLLLHPPRIFRPRFRWDTDIFLSNKRWQRNCLILRIVLEKNSYLLRSWVTSVESIDIRSYASFNLLVI